MKGSSMIAPSCEGVEVYGPEYAVALAKSKAGAMAMAFLTEERLEKLIGSIYGKGYFVAQAHERESLIEMSKAFMTNRTIVIERMDLFGKLRFLKPAEALQTMLELGAAEGLPVAFLGYQVQRLVDDLYNIGIVIAYCAEEPERKWFSKWLETKRKNPVFRLHPQLPSNPAPAAAQPAAAAPTTAAAQPAAAAPTTAAAQPAAAAPTTAAAQPEVKS
jgi:hypothetical protein